MTDANLAAGRIPQGVAFADLGVLDIGAARAAMDRAGVAATGVLDVIDAVMVQALRSVSVERGVDPTELALVAFGGVGPLHACAPADALGMAAVIVPARAGVLSAVGLLGAPRRRELVRSWPGPASVDGLPEAMRALGEESRRLVGPGASVSGALDVRYLGQSHELTVASVTDLHDEHRRRNGYARPDAAVEVVAIRAAAALCSPLAATDLPAVERTGATGPATIVEPDRTIHVAPGWTAVPGVAGALAMRRDEAGGEPQARRARSGRVAGADLPAHRGGRRDGCGAAPGRVQPQHQGARRLLRGPVHPRRGVVGAGRAHPRAPRLDAGIGTSGHRRVRRLAGPGRPGRAQRPLRRRHSPQRHHPWWRRASWPGASSAGSPTARTMPTWAAVHRARSRPTPPRSTRRACAFPRCA